MGAITPQPPFRRGKTKSQAGSAPGQIVGAGGGHLVIAAHADGTRPAHAHAHAQSPGARRPRPPPPPPARPTRRAPPRLLCALLVAAAALAAYANALGGEFVFDDFYAIVGNGDVFPPPHGDGAAASAAGGGAPPRPLPPLGALLRHDFWGQPMASDQSHKSYRPATVLLFRWTLQLHRRLPRLHGGAADLSAPARDPDPLPFHALAVLLHCLASVQVFWVAALLFGRRAAAAAAAAAKQAPPRSSGGGGGGGFGGFGGFGAAANAPLAAPLAAALLFALHPVHTEAVAGAVGAAEPFAASLALAALRLYCSAADWDGGGAAGRGGGPRRRHRHWARVAGALALALLSALAKEVGASVLGAMVLYDVLLALPPPPPSSPLPWSPPPRSPRAPRRERPGPRRRQLLRALACASALALYVGLRVRVASSPTQDGGAGGGGGHLVRVFRRVENPIAFEPDPASRLFSTLHLHALYAGLLAFPLRLSADWSFECVPVTRAPWAADPGQGPILLLHHGRWLALYAALAAVAVAARPLGLARGLLAAWWRAVTARGKCGGDQGDDGDGEDDDERDGKSAAASAAGVAVGGCGGGGCGGSDGGACARWRLFVVAGLIVAPIFPASNVLFYVGTYIGERLLYLPSVGFCLLLADALVPPPSPPLAPPSAAAAAGRRRPSAPALGLLLVLCAYAARTVARNRDWRDEPRLFAAALRVCPRSAKALLNSGILARRRGTAAGFDAALDLFSRARAVDPTYCEASHWIGLTLVEKGMVEGLVASRALSVLEGRRRRGPPPPGRASAALAAAASAASAAAAAAADTCARGMAELHEGGLRCKYVAAQSLQALNRLYAGAGAAAAAAAAAAVGGGGQGPGIQAALALTGGAGPTELLAEWAGVLADPAVSRAGEACAAYEDAALAVATGAAEPFFVAGSGGGGGGGGGTDERRRRPPHRRGRPRTTPPAPRACVASLLSRCADALGRAERGEVAPGSLAEVNMARAAGRGGGGNGSGGGDDGRACGVALASGDGPLLRDGAALLRDCVAMRRPVYLALSDGGRNLSSSSSSPAVKRAAYAYLAALAAPGAAAPGAAAAAAAGREAAVGAGAARCRTAGTVAAAAATGEEDESGALAPSPHQRLIHALQVADPHDAWLQAEWAESVLAAAAAAAGAGEEGGGGGGKTEAAAAAAAPAMTTAASTTTTTTAAEHFEAAGLLLLRDVSRRTAAPKPSSPVEGGARWHRVLHPDPGAWSDGGDDDSDDDGEGDGEGDGGGEEDGQAPAVPLPLALRSATRFLSRRLELSGQQEDPARCGLHQRMCHAHFHLGGLLLAADRGRGGGGGGRDRHGAAASAAAAAVRNGRSCERSLRAECPPHADELRRAVHF